MRPIPLSRYMLADMGFGNDVNYNYDFHGIIAEKRRDKASKWYPHSWEKWVDGEGGQQPSAKKT